ncbi:amidase family protein [Bordetella genomosp. 13]|uniref:amidase family protein n=1 Tax=Bordetella genomosp. 13 TaxID=463040 RepID=UPI0011AA9143|nr:amidase [Bordetella genomosp. 13]
MTATTPAGLPSSIAALRALLNGGDLTVAKALAMQARALAADRWHCVTQRLPDEIAPDLALPLAGVGLAHKDIFRLPGRIPECGAAQPWARAPEAPSSAVSRLTDAGGRALAALAMAEHACGATAENPRHPTPINPLDPRAVVGGSSSGSGVAVAAGLCYGSLGTDTAGSVRIPAATCGVLGLKPTHGAVPVDGGAPLAPSLDCVGVLARGADDAMRIWAALRAAGPGSGAADNRDSHGTHDDPHGIHNDFHNIHSATPAQGAWRLATCWTHADPAASATDASTQTVLDLFAEECSVRGSRRDVALDALPHWMRAAQILLHAEAAATHAAALRGQGPALGALVRGIALPGAVLPAPWYLDALQARAAHTRRFIAEILADADLLLTPALPAGVPDAAEVTTTSSTFRPRRLLELFSWMSFVNYLGLPAVVFPVAYGADGRPVCVQAIARPGGEALLLAFAQQAESRRFDGRGFCRPEPFLSTDTDTETEPHHA